MQMGSFNIERIFWIWDSCTFLIFFEQLLLAFTLNVTCLVGTFVPCGKEVTQVLKMFLNKW